MKIMRGSSSRYWLARLRPLARPVFWAPSIALMLLGLFAWEFFSRQEFISSFGSASSDGELSAEDQAIGADIDSLSLLMSDIRALPKTELVQTSIQATPQQPTPTQTTTNRLFAAASSATPESSQPAPAESLNRQGVFGVFRSALSTQLGVNSAITAVDPTTPAPLPPNQLQAAISKLATTTSPQVAQTLIEGTARLDTPINAAPRSTTNSFSALVEGSQPIPAGVPPVVTAPLVIAPPAAPTYAPIPTVTAAPLPQQPTPDLGTVPSNPELNQQPFTTPRSVPGRVLGGGNINTFSNP
ncbi:MAG: hypothetical protein J0L70_10930 [Leptolyngbya sp. UWPOB_LEPTO1]|uniref:hypothetical protein n=1 Tax=Leptolyngbya sp. UWPOB_LEPTO1 TaxID=2815653 RepID=UPI001AC8476E|nr:hypothetical protein [Leptolyngbya sp. UWPOB_LEPTO1]MBN8561029.1 hypothetical protein [Leptolyngbya sp. UWPOB_LEPTO1]